MVTRTFSFKDEITSQVKKSKRRKVQVGVILMADKSRPVVWIQPSESVTRIGGDPSEIIGDRGDMMLSRLLGGDWWRFKGEEWWWPIILAPGMALSRLEANAATAAAIWWCPVITAEWGGNTAEVHSTSLRNSSMSRLSLARRFWNHVITCKERGVMNGMIESKKERKNYANDSVSLDEPATNERMHFGLSVIRLSDFNPSSHHPRVYVPEHWRGPKRRQSHRDRRVKGISGRGIASLAQRFDDSWRLFETFVFSLELVSLRTTIERDPILKAKR